MDERPDLCDLERAEGGGARGRIMGTGFTYEGALVPTPLRCPYSIRWTRGCPYPTYVPTVECYSLTYIHDSPRYHMSSLPSIAS